MAARRCGPASGLVPVSEDLRPCDIDVQGAPTQLLAVQGINRLLRLFKRIHRHKGKPSRSAGRPVGNETRREDSAVCRKNDMQVVFSEFEVEVPDE
jgi:hypothetical protein